MTEKYDGQSSEIEFDERYYRERIVEFRDGFLLFLVAQRSSLSEALSLSADQQKSIDQLIEADPETFHCFLETVLYSSTGEQLLNCGYNAPGNMMTNSLLSVRWGVFKNRPEEVLITCRAGGFQDNTLKFLFFSNDPREEIVKFEPAYDKKNRLVEEERHYKRLGSFISREMDYSVFGLNCAK